MTHTRAKIKVKDHSVQELEWKRTDRLHEERTEVIALPAVLTQSAINWRTPCRIYRRMQIDYSLEMLTAKLILLQLLLRLLLMAQ